MFSCSTCQLSFKSKRCLTAHFKTKKHLTGNKETKHKCVCGKSFSYRQGLNTHKKTCTYTEPVIESSKILQVLQDKLDKKDQENQEMREEMDELRKQVEMLLSKSTKNTTNNIQTLNSIENQNVHIVVNSFGHENIDHLTDQIICKLIKTAPFTSVPLLIEKIHFDPEHPENHNIKITNKKLNYAEVVKNNKWVTANKKKVIDDVIQKSYDLLDEKYTDNKDDISEKRQERFQNFQDKYEQADEELLRNIKNDVDLLLINGTT